MTRSGLLPDGDEHDVALAEGAKAIHSGKGCTCRRGAKGDAADVIAAYLASLAEQGARFVLVSDVADWLRGLPRVVEDADGSGYVPASRGGDADAFLRRFGGGDA